jgi:hypothetical protein
MNPGGSRLEPNPNPTYQDLSKSIRIQNLIAENRKNPRKLNEKEELRHAQDTS